MPITIAAMPKAISFHCCCNHSSDFQYFAHCPLLPRVSRSVGRAAPNAIRAGPEGRCGISVRPRGEALISAKKGIAKRFSWRAAQA
jgi:hypothetical protein